VLTGFNISVVTNCRS